MIIGILQVRTGHSEQFHAFPTGGHIHMAYYNAGESFGPHDAPAGVLAEIYFQEVMACR